MEDDQAREEENGLVIDNFIDPVEGRSLQESSQTDSDDDLMKTIEPNQVNLDHITPSLFISPEDSRVAPVWTGEQEISSSTNLHPCEGPIEDVPHGFIRSHLSEESFDIPPPPSAPSTIPQLTPYLGFVPYPMYHPQQSHGIMQYPYSSTPFHTVIPYGYSQSLEMPPSHVQQLYMKRIIPQPEFISPVIGSPHLNHGISSHHPPQFNSLASIRHPNAPCSNENVSSGHAGQTFRHSERSDSDFSRTDGSVTLVSHYPSPPPAHSSPVYIPSGGIKEDLDFKPFPEDFHQEICNEPRSLDYNNASVTETYFSEVPTITPKFKVESISEAKKFDILKEEEGNSSSDYDTNGYTRSSLRTCNRKNTNVAISDIDHVYPTQQDERKPRPRKSRNCKNLFHDASLKRSDGTEVPKGGEKTNLKTNNGAELLSCTECHYSSFSKSNFKNHLLIHSDERLFACPHCSYRGKQSAGLRAHLKVHSVEKPFQCSVCNYTSKRKQNLVQHFRIHSKYRPFICSYCSYRSTTKQTLQKHMVKHFREVSKNKKDKNQSRSVLTTAPTVTTTSASNTGFNFIGKQERTDEALDLEKDQDDFEEKMVSSTQLSPNLNLSSLSNNSSNNDSLIYGNPKKYLQLESETEFIACLFCNYKTKEVKRLSKHILSHKLNHMKCTLCDFQCNSPSIFASHIQMHKSMQFSQASNSSLSEDTSNKCETSTICPFNYPTKLSLQCPYCDLDAHSVKYLKQHITNHTDEDFWLFERSPSNLENEGEYEALIQADHQTSTDLTQQIQLKNKMTRQQSENNVSGYLREVVVCTSPKVATTAGNVIHNDAKKNKVLKKYNSKKEKTLKITSRKYPKSFVSPLTNFSVRKNVFKYLRRIGNHKGKVIPAKNLKKIQNRMKLSSKLINPRLKAQPKCTVSTSGTLNDSNVITKLKKVEKVEESDISESCKDDSSRTTDRFQTHSLNEVVDQDAIPNEISCSEASMEETLSPDSNIWPSPFNEEILPQIVSVTSVASCIENSSVRLDDNTQTMKSFLYPRSRTRRPATITQVCGKRYANRWSTSVEALKDTERSLSLDMLEISHDFHHTYEEELESLDVSLHGSTASLTDQSNCPVKKENRESSPKMWDKSFANQGILKQLIFGSNQLSDIQCHKAIQEHESCSSGPQIYTETQEESEPINNCANLKDENSFNLHNQQLLADREKCDNGSKNSITTKYSLKSRSQKPTLTSQVDYSLYPKKLSVCMEPKCREPNSLSDLFKCNNCDAIFRKKSSLVSHKRCHTNDEIKFPKSPNSHRYRRAKQDREISQSKRKSFKCTECDFSSARKCSLMSHCRVHKRKISASVALSSTTSQERWGELGTENGETSANQETIVPQTNTVEYIAPLPEGSLGKILKVD